MRLRLTLLFCAIGAVVTQTGYAHAAACIEVDTPQELSNIRNNLAGDYCLTKSVDLGSIPNFVPIGDFAAPFTGTLDGRGRVIRNLKISSSPEAVGLFGIVDGGVVRDLGLVNVNINSSAFFTGALAGGIVVNTAGGSATIVRCYATGPITGGGLVGGLVGAIIPGEGAVEIIQSYATGPVTGTDAGASVGGLVGNAASGNAGIVIKGSYATGRVTGGGNSAVGGLVGQLYTPFDVPNEIDKSHAVGPASGGDNSVIGGLIGHSIGANTITHSFAIGPVVGSLSIAGGLVGILDLGKIRQSYAAGRVSGGPGAITGGLVAQIAGSPVIAASFWDNQTTAQTTSAGGIGMTTAQLQAKLPPGFQSDIWAITPNVSYPYFKALSLGFDAPLASIVFHREIFSFLPISQLNPAQYSANVSTKNRTSLATVYTMIVRAIGTARNVAVLSDAKINQYWNDGAKTAIWHGAIINHAFRGPLTAIPSSQPIGQANVIGHLRLDRLVILRGAYGEGDKAHWMLATSFIVNSSGKVTGVVADDPWTGTQVTISASTKRVVFPLVFPLHGFTVNAF